MKRITKITVLALGLAGVVRAQTTGEQEVVPEYHKKVLTFDVAIDCRTAAGGTNRGDVFITNGKLFPAGTLPSGPANFYPTDSVNGVAPIGDWIIRGQHSFPFPPAIARLYSSSPFDFATVYFILNGRRTALIGEAYNFFPFEPFQAFTAVTGGVGRFKGASGEFVGSPPIGTNATGCWNFRTRINLVRGRSSD
jgi:hypothetical protein